jgi:hypothetical protein
MATMTYLYDPRLQNEIKKMINDYSKKGEEAMIQGDHNKGASYGYEALLLLQLLSGTLTLEQYAAEKNRLSHRPYKVEVIRHAGVERLYHLHGTVDLKKYAIELMNFTPDLWADSISTPAFRSVSPIMILIPNGETVAPIMHPPPIRIWWEIEDQHAADPVGTQVLVWSEQCDETIMEYWIERISESDGIQWAHMMTWHGIDTPSVLPRA